MGRERERDVENGRIEMIKNVGIKEIHSSFRMALISSSLLSASILGGIAVPSSSCAIEG